MNPDTDLFLSINGFARSAPWLQPIVLAYANFGIVAFGALMLVGWWVARRSGDPGRMAAAIWVPIATLIAVGLNQPIAAIANQPRPYTALPDILVLAGRSLDPYFPSDHSVMAGADPGSSALLVRTVVAAERSALRPLLTASPAVPASDHS